VSRYSFGLGLLGEELGMPIPKYDLSASVGMGRIVPGLKEIAQSFDGVGNPRDVTGDLSKGMAGAGFGVVFNLLQFLAEEGSYTEAKKWERIVPTAAKNMMKGSRLLAEGKETDSKGATIWKLDANDPAALAEGVGQLLGFTPTGLSKTYQQRGMIQEAVKFWDGQRVMLLKNLDEAYRRKDQALIKKVSEQIRRYNAEVPYKGKALKFKDIQQSLKARARARALTEQGLPQNPRQNLEIQERVRRLFPQ